jgi:hypothetical protein
MARARRAPDPADDDASPDVMPMPDPADPMPAAAPAAPSYAPPAQAWAPAPARASWTANPKETVRRVALILALVFLAISLVVAYVSANSIVELWFEHQWVPVARLVLALGIAGLALWVVLRLTQRR